MTLLKRTKKLILLLIDVGLINLSYFIVLYLTFSNNEVKLDLNMYKYQFLIGTLVYVIIYALNRMYNILWKYASIDELLMGVFAGIISTILLVIGHIVMKSTLSIYVHILAGILIIAFTIGYRMSFRIYRRVAWYWSNKISKENKTRVMVIGAGSAGAMVIREMKSYNINNYSPKIIIDDDKYKLGKKVAGVEVAGTRDDIIKLVEEYKIDNILFAIPSIDLENKKAILNICKKTNCKIQTVPGIYEIIDGRVDLNRIREVKIEDLLGREPVKLDAEGIQDYIKDHVVLVTGGGGSIGSELCRQIVKFKPTKLIILDIYENNVYELQRELLSSYPHLDLEVLIASVRDKHRLNQIFKRYKPNVVFHAAAHKHVPLMETSPMEAIKNNVFGTYNVAECSDKYDVRRFVLISTDKAVNPTNIMGATKRMCEMIIQSMDKVSKTEFVAVRFGNVLGSNGSVIPIFKKQIEKGGPVTVTNKYITRYFMTIPEAAQLVLQAGAYAKGGEIFVLDMGKPVKIYDLACDLVRLSGFEPNKDIKIEITGLRPGEKLYEELLMSEEGLKDTNHEKIFIGKPTYSDIIELKKQFSDLERIIANESESELIEKIREIVPTYKIINNNDLKEVGVTKK